MNSPNAAANLASVVFLKVQEFARRPAQEQARMRAQLEAVVAVTTADLAHAGWIALDAADGVAIAVLADPEGALRLAQRSLTAAAAGLPLSIGINHGAVQVTSGKSGPDGMTGDGIAVAASVAEFAASTRVLISRSFREALAGRGRRRLFAFGHVAAIALVGAGIGARAATGGHQKVLDATMGKVGMSAKQREAWLRGLRE